MKVLFLLDNTFENDRRVYCEAKTLVNSGHEVHLYGVKSAKLENEEVLNGIKIHRIFGGDIYDIKKSKCFIRYASIISKAGLFDVIHAHDQAMLHLGVILKKRNIANTLVYDSHELFHEWPNNLGTTNVWIRLKATVVRKLMVFREKQNAKYIDHLVTVCDSLAYVLKPYFKIRNEPIVLRNLPYQQKIIPESNYLRKKFDLPNSTKILVYIGKNIYLQTINIEQVLEEFRNAPDVAIIFICGQNEVTKRVKIYIEDKGYKNTFFHDLIQPSEIQNVLSSADAGLLSTWNKKDKSYWLSLGNKLFEYIQSGIPVLTTAQPEHLKVIDQYKCGVAVNPDLPGAYLQGFDEIIGNYSFYANNSKQASSELNWENEEQKLIDFYNNL